MENYFVLEGKRKLIIRKEGEYYILFDPIDLDFYKINNTGAEILYLISLNKSFIDMINYFMEKYNLEQNYVNDFVKNYLNSFPLKHIIMNNLINLGIYEAISA